MRSVVTVLLLCVVAILPGCGPVTFTLGQWPGDLQYRQTVVADDTGLFNDDRVAMIDLSGMLYSGRKSSLLRADDNPVSILHQKLEFARQDGRVKAVVLRLNTPGGTVTASDAIYREIHRFRRLSKKPVVAQMMELAASGGYYSACACDRIVAYPTTITGSIGVIFQTFTVKTLLDRWGVETRAFVSGPNKEIASPLIHPTAEQQRILQHLVDDFYARFVAIVKEARPAIPAEQFAAVTDGRIFTGDAALKLGLIDEVGDVYDGFAAAKKLAGIRRAKLVLYSREDEFHGSAYAAASLAAPATAGLTQNFNLAQINLDAPLPDASSGFYYLWLPNR